MCDYSAIEKKVLETNRNIYVPPPMAGGRIYSLDFQSYILYTAKQLQKCYNYIYVF
jgi:hypothetical protein